jgi:pimeloyl-ACP methyl ester carboxylesterase
MASALPAALHAAIQSRFEPLLGLASSFGMKESRDRPPRLFTGMHLSVICSEDLPRLPLAASTDQNPAGATFSTQQKDFYLKACADWPRAVVSPSFYTVPAAATPVLLLSGGADPATPPRHAERTAKLLGVKAVHLVAPHVAHGVMGNPCGARLVTRFIADDNPAEALRREGGCLADMPRPGVFITGRVIEGAAHD